MDETTLDVTFTILRRLFISISLVLDLWYFDDIEGGQVERRHYCWLHVGHVHTRDGAAGFEVAPPGFLFIAAWKRLGRKGDQPIENPGP